jgi:hypothetical protein
VSKVKREIMASLLQEIRVFFSFSFHLSLSLVGTSIGESVGPRVFGSSFESNTVFKTLYCSGGEAERKEKKN